MQKLPEAKCRKEQTNADRNEAQPVRYRVKCHVDAGHLMDAGVKSGKAHRGPVYAHRPDIHMGNEIRPGGKPGSKQKAAHQVFVL